MRLDFSGVKSFEAVPAGSYHVQVTSFTEETSKTSGNPMLKLELTIQTGEFTGQKVFTNLSLQPQALWKLKSFLDAVGMETEGAVDIDTNAVLGRELSVSVTVEEYEGKNNNKVDKFSTYTPAKRR